MDQDLLCPVQAVDIGIGIQDPVLDLLRAHHVRVRQIRDLHGIGMGIHLHRLGEPPAEITPEHGPLRIPFPGQAHLTVRIGAGKAPIRLHHHPGPPAACPAGKDELLDL